MSKCNCRVWHIVVVVGFIGMLLAGPLNAEQANISTAAQGAVRKFIQGGSIFVPHFHDCEKA